MFAYAPGLTLLLLFVASVDPSPNRAPPSTVATPRPAPRRADLASLTPSETQRFEAVAADEFCGCSSPLTLAGCLKERPDCALAQDMAQLLGRLVRTRAPQHAIAAFTSRAVLGPFCAPPASLQLTGAARTGTVGAPLTVVEFADFRCSHCRDAVAPVHAALKRFKGQMQLIYAPLVLDETSPSMAAAEAAMAALEQDKFWPMHAALFAQPAADFNATTLLAAAKKAGLDIARYQDAMAQHRHRKTLIHFKSEAIAAGLTGTPLFFINGRPYTFKPEQFPLEERLQMELDRDAGRCD